jgi:serine/threonine protein phosphatase 1
VSDWWKFWRRERLETYPAGPSDRVLYAVGDVHGRLDLLAQVQAQIGVDRAGRDGPAFLEIYLGDLVDRGAESAQVVENVKERVASGQALCLRGNHEAAFLRYLAGDLHYDTFSEYGGEATLRSYGVPLALLRQPDKTEEILDFARAAVPPSHVQFLESMPLYHRAGNYLFVHAGIMPGRPLADQVEQDLMWIRDDFLRSRADHGFIVVHGHTPRAAPEFRRNRIGIDTRAYASNRLTCLRIDRDGPRVLGD